MDDLSTGTTNIRMPINLDNTARSAKTDLEIALDNAMKLFAQPERAGISKEERKKRTKAKKAAKKQRNR